MGWSERCLLRNDSDTALYDQEGSSNDLRRNTAGRRCLWRAELGDTVQRSDVCLEHGGRGGEQRGDRYMSHRALRFLFIVYCGAWWRVLSGE